MSFGNNSWQYSAGYSRAADTVSQQAGDLRVAIAAGEDRETVLLHVAAIRRELDKIERWCRAALGEES